MCCYEGVKGGLCEIGQEVVNWMWKLWVTPHVANKVAGRCQRYVHRGIL